MEKIKSFILDVWTSHPFLIVRMALVSFVILCLYKMNEKDFSWLDELGNVFLYAIGFLFVYTLAVCLTPSRAEGSPLMLASKIQDKVNELLGRRFRPKKGVRGLYTMDVSYSEETKTLTHIYKPVENPERVIIEIEILIPILYALLTYSSEKQAEKLMEWRKEAQYMLENSIEIIYEHSK